LDCILPHIFGRGESILQTFTLLAVNSNDRTHQRWSKINRRST